MVWVSIGAVRRRVLLKCEWHNPTGSVKDRTAASLVAAMAATEPLRPGTVVVESTSGNLGIALARLIGALDGRLIAVIDPKTPAGTRTALAAAGAEVVMVDEVDGTGGYLLNRLRTVRELCERHPEYRRPDQYLNPANPLVHQRTTGPEIVAQGGPELDAVYVAVSTGGTLAGIAAHLRVVRPRTQIVAVDVRHSMALGAGTPGPRLIPGIGSSRPSSFLSPHPHHRSVLVDDAAATAMCQMLVEDTGLRLGGSGGCALLACVGDLLGSRPPRRALCLCPDGGDKYLDTLYRDEWLETAGVLTDIKEAHNDFRAHGLRFELED
jgi:cysteine synthase